MPYGRISMRAPASCSAEPRPFAAWDPPPQAARRDREVLVKRLRHEGFVIFDHVARFAEVANRLAGVAPGRLAQLPGRHRAGLDRAPEALAGLYRGQNDGKKIIEL